MPRRFPTLARLFLLSVLLLAGCGSASTTPPDTQTGAGSPFGTVVSVTPFETASGVATPTEPLALPATTTAESAPPSESESTATVSAEVTAEAVTTVAATTEPVATAAPTPVVRTGDAKDVILSTTTSTQDSGLLDLLIPQFEQQTGYRVKTIAVGSGAAIALGQRGESDVVLAHAPDNERTFVASGAGADRQLVMYNDFILVGPADDPAGLKDSTEIVPTMQKLATSGSTFVSRADNSGTNQLELKLWQAAAVTPQSQPWYIESGTGMGQTLQIADQRQAYTITDRATYLAWSDRVSLQIVSEGDPALLNIYHVIAVNAEQFPQVNREGAQALIQFLLAPETQQTIGSFGQDKYGQALFTACAANSCKLQNPDG